MIVELPDTTVSAVSKRLVTLREDGGAVALGRVLTLVIVSEHGQEEEAIAAANEASREHPMRVIVVSNEPANAVSGEARLDAQIRVGGDAGASEVIILSVYGDAARSQESLITGLLLPDAPVVAWWPGVAPAGVAQTALGRMAQRRITDASVCEDPTAALELLSQNYSPGDTDFAWTRLTLWRAQLAAVLDQPPYEPVTAVVVAGASDSPSTTLLAAWLRRQLDAPVTQEHTPRGSGETGIHSVRLVRPSGDVEIARPFTSISATLTLPNQPQHEIAMPRRSLRDCLAEELRRLDPDALYGDVITVGLPALLAETA
ncbi:glucose-6-phosphate dehydrogenase assembly protein OpcA [Mycetocola spongiae]|uniref:glucose-6-phosphate dehydrogenase assembly protein OpcA n=1 Tax=Mycetocola spongiae TaxID=2859226 RepID=UPI001CF424D5|nr:glucose-6-phosphate dehydrogenase assembly protein OpcA [Mycetocola spongiae]UCR89711.1 glucose-6-phosphate dehydrogenase assembly protein OpcA [Mycetocola spongiae]